MTAPNDDNGGKRDDDSGVRSYGVRDPRLPVNPVPLLADPRMAANRDLIALERRRSWNRTKERRKDEPLPWVTGPKAADSHDAAGIFKDLIVPKKAAEPQGVTKGLTGSDTAPHADDATTEQDPLEKARSAAADADRAAQLTMLQYRYTKGLDIVNDEMGYGERIIDLFWRQVQGGALTANPRLSQRTKSGRQQLK